MFSYFQYALASVFYFPTLFPTMYSFPEQRSVWALCVRAVFTNERFGQTVIVKCEESDGSVVVFASPAFQWGLKLKRNSQRTMAHRPWNQSLLKGIVSKQQTAPCVLIKITFIVIFFHVIHTYSHVLTKNN